MTNKIYRGRLALGSNGLDFFLLCLVNPDDFRRGQTILAEAIAEDISCYGNYLNVCYYVSELRLGVEEIRAAFIRELVGAGSAKYEVHYSEITGYLYTEQDLQVGGHDLLSELKSHLDQFCQLEIDYHRQPPV